MSTPYSEKPIGVQPGMVYAMVFAFSIIVVGYVFIRRIVDIQV